MTVKLHQPVAGLATNAEYTGPMEAWLVVNGYASRAADATDKTNVTDVLPAADLTSAANREAPGAPFKVLGEDATPAPENAAELDATKAPEAPLLRNATLGREERPEVAEQTARLDGSVDPATVAGFPAELEEAVVAAEGAAETGDHLLTEPTAETKAPTKRATAKK